MAITVRIVPIIEDVSEEECYDAGYSCVEDGPDLVNCHFRFFQTPERTAAWERGEAAAKRDKEGQHG